MRTEPFKDYAIINIVTNPLDYEILFENPKVKPWELYLGLDFSLDVIKNNNNDYCMALMAGATGSGKSRLLFMMILSWILSCSITEVEIYIADIIKDGFSSFKYAKHVKAYATDLEELLKILQYLKIKLDKRRKTISPLRENGIASNIVEFNKTQKVKMSYCYLCIDEFSFIMPDKTDRKEEKELKEEVLDLIKQFEKVGREMGIFILNGLQKAVKDELPSLIKSQSGLRISFRANDSISSEVIMGDNSAVGLMKRYAVYSKNGGEKNYLFSPKLTTERLKELLSPHIDKNYKKPDLYYTIKASKIPMQPPSRVTKIKNPIDIKDLHDRNKFKNIPYNLINSEGDEFNDY